MLRVKSLAGVSVAVLVATPVSLVLPKDGWAQGIEEIVVTTRRKSESLQEVPIAVTAIGAEAIDRQGINGLADVAKLDPSVGFDTSYGPADTRVAIRGLSNTRGRSNVAFLIDGVDVTTENVIAAGSGLLANQRLLTDVERIEIVKGPQSALYGRAAFAGALSYTTKNPSDVFEASVRADVGDYGNQQYSGFISSPIGETQGFRADGVVWSEDGYYKNQTTGNYVGGGEGFGLSGTYTWDPSDVFGLKARLTYSDDQYGVTPNYHLKSTKFVEEPEIAYTPVADGGAGLGTPIFSGTKIASWKPYCPDVIALPPTGAGDDGTPSNAVYQNNSTKSGLCLPESMGKFAGNEIRFDASPKDATKDNEGTSQELLRFTLNGNWDLEYGTFTYTGGYTAADSWTSLDQDYQYDAAAHQQGDYGTETTQLSNEIRFASSWDGPVQLTAGFLKWDERRRTEDRNFIIGCTRSSLRPDGTIILDQPGACDGNFANSFPGFAEGVSGNTIDWRGDLWRTAYNQFAPGIGPGSPETAEIAPTYWKAKTDHKSVYAAIDWDISEKWKATIEDRYVDETFSLKKPNQASCTILGIATGATVAGVWVEDGATTDNVSGQPWEQKCTHELSGRQGNGNGGNTWAYLEGSVNSKYHTPKVTLNWYPGDDAMMYASVGRGQKPAGINQLSGGGSAETFEAAQFLPEKMTAYELGTKTSWEAAGALQVNSALFFQDYTDKQISTQQEDASGQLKPVITNAGGAEVFGFEIDATWLPDAIDGLTLSASYTFLNAKYTKWAVDVTSEYNVLRSQQCEVVENSESANTDFCRINFAGNGLERSPENALVTQINYTRGLGSTGMEWFIEGNSQFQDERFVDAENSLKFDSYWMTDLRLGLLADKWDALIYVDNVFDDDTIKTGGSGPDFGPQVRELGFLAGFGVNHYFATAPEPRVIGVRASYRFGGE